MASPQLFSLARMTVASSGTGNITLGTAVSGFLTFDGAGCSTAATGQRLAYAISDTTQSEIGYGTYFSSGPTITRGSSTAGLISTNTNSPIAMSNGAQVFITPPAIFFQAPTISTVSTAAFTGNFSAAGSGTYTTPNNVTYLKVTMVGGGGGGAGSAASAGGTSGSSGGTTTFGSTYVCVGGNGGQVSGSGGLGGVGGTAAGGYLNFTGQNGWANGDTVTGGSGAGGSGGCSPFFALGAQGSKGSPPSPAQPTTGCGGAGGEATTQAFAAAGGGGGGGLQAFITSPSSVYAFAVGAGGVGGTAGSVGANGGTGGGGIIIVEEHYGS